MGFEIKYRNTETKTDFQKFRKQYPEAETLQITKNTKQRKTENTTLATNNTHINSQLGLQK